MVLAVMCGCPLDVPLLLAHEREEAWVPTPASCTVCMNERELFALCAWQHGRKHGSPPASTRPTAPAPPQPRSPSLLPTWQVGRSCRQLLQDACRPLAGQQQVNLARQHHQLVLQARDVALGVVAAHLQW